MIGQLLAGRYLILESLGTGGFSETYLARDKYLPHYPLCVVKCLKLPDSGSLSLETAQQLFETEARLLDQLGQNHSQIPTLFAYCHEQDQVYLVQEYGEGDTLTSVSTPIASEAAEQILESGAAFAASSGAQPTQAPAIFGYCHEPGQIYLVQEYIEGETLATWVSQKRRLTPEAAIALLQDLLPVLDYIHSQGVVHGDIKPGNLIYRHADGKLVLIDFGAACPLSEIEDQTRAYTTLAIGTPGYMPEEQNQGKPQFCSDLYSLGMLVIHLLTSADPRQFQPDPISGSLDWHSHLPESNIHPKLVAILDRMVCIAARDRYQQAADVLAALQPLLSMAESTTPQKAATRRWLSRDEMPSLRSVGKFAAAAVLIVGAIGGGYFYKHQEKATMLLTTLHLRSPTSGDQLTRLHDLSLPFKIDRMLITPDNQMLIAAGTDQALHLWSLPEGKRLRSLSGATGTVTAMDMSHDGTLLVSGSDDHTVRLWNVTTGNLLRTFEGHEAAVTAVGISPDGQLLISGSKDGILRLWSLPTGKLLRTFTIPNAAVTTLACSGMPNWLITASSDRANTADRQIQVWDLRTGKLHRTFTGHTEPIVDLKLVNEQTLLSFSQDRTLVWNLKREELALVFPQDAPAPMTASLDDQNVVTVHTNGDLRVWAYKTGKPVSRSVGALGQSLDVAISANHRYVASWNADQRLRIWQMDVSNIH